MSTAIQWTDETWNPVTGCSKVSPGCAHCYAERLAPKVFAGQTVSEGVEEHDAAGYPVWVKVSRPRVFTDVRCHEDRLDAPLHWKKPRRVFVNSMSDLFHEDVPDAFIRRVFETMSFARRHTFQILTKRAGRMHSLVATFAADHTAADGSGWPLPNVWLGVSVENQHFADERIPLLLQTPAAVRFLSCEPLLGPLNLIQFLAGGIQWVIFGGESGSGARPMNLAWVRSGVRQCRDAGVAPFIKQLGAWAYDGWPAGAPFPPLALRKGRRQIAPFLNLKHKKGGDISEFPPDLQVREFPEVRA